MRKDLHPDAVMMIQGFYAVEQFVPDYTSKILALVRESEGRSNFQLRWGSEEEKHSATWENALLFCGQRSLKWIDDYKHALQKNRWSLPWDDALHMLAYTVFQERATQLTYMNFGALARGEGSPEQYGDAVDPVLESACKTLAGDEAAHYSFFGNGLRLYLYYFPTETLEAINDVLAHFAMPAHDVIPNWQMVAEAIYRTGVYGPRQFGRNVLVPVFKSLSLRGKKAIELGLKRSRLVPDADGAEIKTALWDAFEPEGIRTKAQRIFDKIHDHDSSYGRHALDPIKFVADTFWHDPVQLAPSLG